MRISWEPDVGKVSMLYALLFCMAVGLVLAALLYIPYGFDFVVVLGGAGVGLAFWSTLAVQDLRLSRR